MTISDNKKIIEIQRELYQLFPYLKIEFYQEHDTKKEVPSNLIMISPNETIKKIRTINQSGDLKITGQLTVFQLESAFKNKYGLTIQVRRKSGNHWFQTFTTDDWTLDKQNETGKDSMIHPVDDPFINS